VNREFVDGRDCPWNMRDATGRAAGQWSNDRELFGAAEPGGYLEVELAVPESGEFTLVFHFTNGPDYGRVAVALDGQPLGTPYDGFAPEVLRSERISLGTRALDGGRHRLRFTSVGKDPRATHAYFAVDCLELLQRSK
jgi:hypothetical protein